MADELLMAQSVAAPSASDDAVTSVIPVEGVEDAIEDVASNVGPVVDYIRNGVESLAAQFFSAEGLYQLAVIVLCGIVALALSKPLRKMVRRVWPVDDETSGFRSSAYNTFVGLITPIMLVFLLWLAVGAFRSLGVGNDLMRILASLLNAWIVIRLFSTFVRDPLWSKAFATVAWVIAALNILRLLNPTISLLDSLAITMGEARLSLYLVIKGILLLVVLLWLANLLTRFVQARVGRAENLTPSVRTLIAQAVRIGLLFAAIMLAMNAIGVDLTALAVFSGAVGVGIGFGLQAIFSNLVAGIIMLLERSIKVGDFVELESGLTGEVREINIRATLVTTNDNVDILVPNSEFINNRVTNWTLRDGWRRTRVGFGVAYGTDKELVKKAALEAAANVPHMLKGKGAKPPEVWLTNFGDSSLDFELVVWLTPAAVKRPGAVNADYKWAIETALTKYGIEIPFPQRDLHIRSGDLPIKLTQQSRSG
ncbi:mechanosensitive ion channel [Rhizobiaceae bacterium]|nr:mechanosensitive ion channel [Rhizobiaceae bacterium]